MTNREQPEGWFTFGTHADDPCPLEFSEETGEDGLPLWERPLVQPPVKHFPSCGKCSHSWHGLPCNVHDCRCETACINPPVIPRSQPAKDNRVTTKRKPKRPSGTTSRRLGKHYNEVPAVLQRHPDLRGGPYPGIVVMDAFLSG